jgi:hypothetical protein
MKPRQSHWCVQLSEQRSVLVNTDTAMPANAVQPAAMRCTQLLLLEHHPLCACNTTINRSRCKMNVSAANTAAGNH